LKHGHVNSEHDSSRGNDVTAQNDVIAVNDVSEVRQLDLTTTSTRDVNTSGWRFIFIISYSFVRLSLFCPPRFAVTDTCLQSYL